MTIQRTDTRSRNLTVRIAESDAEIYEAQRLRYKVFAEECGAMLI
jgi:putative hemolysin